MLERKHVLIAFGFGILAGFIASWVESVYLFPVIIFVYPSKSLFILILACVLAPFAEEIGKPIGLYFMKMEENVNYPADGWMYLGALCGLGFGLIENVVYTLNTIQMFNLNTGIMLLILRTLLSLPLHMIATTISGFGFGLYINTGNIKYFIYAVTVSMCIHGFFNFTAMII